MKYIVETTYPYEFYHCETIKKAKKKSSELHKQGKYTSIICINENGNDYILKN